MTIRLYMTLRSVFYAPFYAAHTLGAYDAEGIEVVSSTAPDPEDAPRALIDGRVDVTCGGPIDLMAYHDRDPNCDLVGFCEVVSRDPFILVGQQQNAEFRFSNLLDRRFAPVCDVETPWLCLQDDIRRAGIDPATLATATEGSMTENVAALRNGEVDVIQVFEPYVEALVHGGLGHVWYAGASRGLNTYTTLFTTRRTLERERDALYRMTRALYRTQKWVDAHDGAEISAAIAELFPEIDHAILAGAMARYKALGIWGPTPVHSPEGFVRLKCAVIAGGWISRDVPYEACITTELAERVVAENPSPL